MADNIIAVEVRNATILPFRGLELPVFRHRLKQYVAIRPLCEMLGVDAEGQRQRILGHPVTAEGAMIFAVPEFSGTYLENRSREDGVEHALMRVARAEELNAGQLETCVTQVSSFEALNPKRGNWGGARRIFCLEKRLLVLWLMGFHPNRYEGETRDRLIYAQKRINSAIEAHGRVFEQGRGAHLSVARFMEL